MMQKRSLSPFVWLMMLAMAGCAQRSSETGIEQPQFHDTEPVCRAQAYRSAHLQMAMPQDVPPGAAASDTARDITVREAELCLEQRGFVQDRGWQQ